MAKLELSRSLPMTADQAWAHASDLAALGDWMVMHQGWRSELPEKLCVGTEIIGVAGAKGMRNRVTWTVRSYDPPSELEISGAGVGGTKYALSMKVASIEEGCTFSLRMELGGAPLFGPIGVAAVRAVKGDIEKSISTFAKLYS